MLLELINWLFIQAFIYCTAVRIYNLNIYQTALSTINLAIIALFFYVHKARMKMTEINFHDKLVSRSDS